MKIAQRECILSVFFTREDIYLMLFTGHIGDTYFNTITSYSDFTQRLMERFDKRGPKIHFRELAQLKQTGSAETFISEFQTVAVITFA